MKIIKLALIALVSFGVLAPFAVEAKPNKAPLTYFGDTVAYVVNAKTETIQQLDAVTLTELGSLSISDRLVKVTVVGDKLILTLKTSAGTELVSYDKDLAETGRATLLAKKAKKEKPSDKDDDEEDSEEDDSEEEETEEETEV